MMEGLKTRYKVIDYDHFSSRKSCLASAAQVFLEDYENNDVGVTDQQKLFLDTEKCLKEFIIKRLNVSALQSVHPQPV